MKKVVNREETVKQISVAYPDFHTIAAEPDVTVLGTALADNVTRSICIIKTEEVGFAMQKLSEQGQFITQFVPISALMLSKVVFSEVEEPKPEDVTPIDEDEDDVELAKERMQMHVKILKLNSK